MGLKLLKIWGSRVGFFKSGCTNAALRVEGKQPVDREQLTMFKILGPIVCKTSLKNLVGIVSRGQEEDFIWEMVFSRPGREIWSNMVSVAVGAGQSQSALDSGMICCLIASILVVKWVRSSSHFTGDASSG